MESEQPRHTAGGNASASVSDMSKRMEKMTDDEILDILKRSHTGTEILLYSRELLFRLYRQNAELKKRNIELDARLAALENRKSSGRAGRTRQIFVFNDKILDDDLLVRMIDGDFLTIRELEKEVGAKKNTLRNRYNRAKRREASNAPTSEYPHTEE